MPKKKSSAKRRQMQKFSDLVPFMLVLGVFCAISVYLLTSFFVSLQNYTYQASVLVADNPVTGEPHSSAQGYVFKDVPYTHRNGTAILYFRDVNIVSGYEDGTFEPAKDVNRAEFLKILIGALGADVSTSVYADCFTDVRSEWFAPYVCYAKDHGWVGGYSDGSYQPDKSVNKAEAVKIATVAFGYNIPDYISDIDKPFADTPPDHWYTPYIYAALQNSLLEEKGDLQYFPSDSMKRAGAVELIYRAMFDQGLVKPTI